MQLCIFISQFCHLFKKIFRNYSSGFHKYFLTAGDRSSARTVAICSGPQSLSDILLLPPFAKFDFIHQFVSPQFCSFAHIFLFLNFFLYLLRHLIKTLQILVTSTSHFLYQLYTTLCPCSSHFPSPTVRGPHLICLYFLQSFIFADSSVGI